VKAVVVLVSTLVATVSGANPGLPALPMQPRDVLVLRRATVIDGLSPQPLRDVTVVVRDGRIVSVSRGSPRVPAGARIIDVDGRWLLPGLIDAHVHLRDLDSARAALRSGVTTARSLGVNRFSDIDIRQRHGAGAFNLPDVVAAGYHVRRRVAEDFFLDAPELRGLASGLAGVEDLRRVVRVMVERGADVIKVMVTERAGMPDTDPLRRVLTDREVTVAVAEAQSAGLPVAAHAHSDEGARAAVLAGVRTIEHGTLLGAETLALMRKRGTCFVPTISFWQDMLDAGGEYDHPDLAVRAREMLPSVRNATALASKMGVTVVAGSDMRYDASSTRTVAHEVAELIGAGVPPMGAIKAATSGAAQCLGVGGRTGSIRTGLQADLIAFDRDPLQDAGALRHPLLVINDGRVALDRLAPPLK
jgi:imidazolonepropionase-like amidohydrolase